MMVFLERTNYFFLMTEYSVEHIDPLNIIDVIWYTYTPNISIIYKIFSTMIRKDESSIYIYILCSRFK